MTATSQPPARDATGGPSPSRRGRPGSSSGQSPPRGRPHRQLSSPWGERLTILVPALLAYLPLLLTQPGQVGADTKTYLYLDPSKLLADAPYVWDSQIGLGTVTHQNIGYLFPMGPFYLILDLLHVPDWIAQRLWTGTVIFCAGMGIRYLLRTIDFGGSGLGRWRRPTAATRAEEAHHAAARQTGILVATLAYMLSPYLLDYSARISVILLPWVALPWLVALMARSLRSGGWWYPSAFALVVLAVGGINATALIMIMLAPLLFLAHQVFVDREGTPRQAIGVLIRIGVLTGATSLWWVAGLWAEGRYGLPVIRYTETYRAVAGASNAPEVLRGLGYWFFYGNDKLGPWIESSVDYTSSLPILALSYLLPITALTVAAMVRWRYRMFFMAVIVFGTLIAVGGHPWESPSFLGGLFKAFTTTNAGLSLRSTPRAVPLVALGTSVFLGVGMTALARRLPRLTVPVSIVVTALIVANIPTLWNGTMVAANLKRPEQIPDYWLAATASMDAGDHQTRVWEVPGADFASYRWGNTVDPITPGLMDRPYVARELFQWGSPPSAALVNAIDRRLQEGTAEPSSLAPIARTFAVGEVVLRADLQYERYRTARPRDTWNLLGRSPGLQPPVAFTPPTDSQARDPQPLVDELELQRLRPRPDAPLLSSFGVDGTVPIVRAQRTARPLLLAGDADGLVDAASVGLVSTDQPTFFAAAYDNPTKAKDPTGDATSFDRIYGNGADLVVTDSNRKRAARWGALRENNGYTERAGEKPLVYDPGDQRLEVFPGAGDSSFTVTEQRGGTVTATAYGNPITYTPDDRPANAFDGDPTTAWRVGAIDSTTGERLIVDLDKPVTTDHISVVQPLTLVRNRWITGVRLHFDGGPPVDMALDLSSRTEPGQELRFPSRTFRHLEIEITADDLGPKARYDGVSGVGFSEVRIPGVDLRELVRPPTQLLERAGASSIDHRLSLLFSRVRANPAEPVRTDEESRLLRVVTLPTERTFSLTGTARLSPYVPDTVIDQLLRIPDARQGGVTASSSAYLPGALDQRSTAAVDGDPTTAWTSIYEKQEGHWLEYVLPAPVTFDHLDLDIVTDEYHSVPKKLRIDADGQVAATVELPDLPAKPERGATTHVRVDTPPVTGRQLRVAIEQATNRTTKDWYTDRPTTLPVAIAELGIPGVSMAKPADAFDTGCRSDLLFVDDQPVPLRVVGTSAGAVDRQGLRAEPCGDDPTVHLSAGDHIIRTAPGNVTGIDLDRLLFGSAPGGAAVPADELTQPTPTPPGQEPPVVTVTSEGRVSYDATTAGATQPFWLVVGQSWNAGWDARVNGVSMGSPQIINGYGNGWYVDPATVPDPAHMAITVVWTPQRVVWIAIFASLVGLIGCVAILFLARRRTRPDVDRRVDPDRPFDPEFVPLPLRRAAWRDAEVLSWRTTAVATGLLTVFALVNLPTVRWQLALVVPFAALVAWSFRSRAGRSVLGLAGAACLAGAAAFFVLQQARHRFPPDFVWPQLFDRVHVLGVLAVLLVGAEATRELVRRRGRPRPTEE